ncbi:HAMP domain-containing sensor histidine kinase [Loigolactobacillus binensis]|uniref:HAMP domain-containing sensor histidine kinase n=1 Tax=Loigolactobacillus binensis TaxID=2559922 RepID=UPI00402B7EA8
MKKFFSRSQDSAAIMLRSFLFMITVVMMVFSATMILAVGHQLLETSQSNSDNIIKNLKTTVIDGDHDWKAWRFNSTLNTSTSYVHVHNMRQDAAETNYYSPGTQNLLRVKFTKIPLVKNLYYRPHTGFLLFNTGHAKGIDYQLWTKLNAQFAVLERVLLVVVIILILTLLISPLYIRLIAVRLTGALKQLTTSAEQISTRNQAADPLPVPTSPTEVANLANSFNRLLNRLFQQTEKEKLFVANAAHELRTPIATIQSHAQLIQRRGKAHPEIIARSIDYINDESHQMATLIEELLTLSRADRTQLDFQPYDLSQSLQTLISKMTPVIPQKIKVTVPTQIKVTAHQASIEQILTNLINNASKYSPATSEITVSLQQEKHQVSVYIADQGRGISAADKPHIFERFYRASDVRGSTQGTGLGLAIAWQLAELNQATLTVADNQPQGTIFKLEF